MEILTRIHKRESTDLFGFERGDLIAVLPYSSAKEFFKSEIRADDWTPDARDREGVLKTMREYMDFAWGKALDHRGISASRSVSHLHAWVWLLGDEDYAAIPWAHYAQYGAPVLKAVTERFGFAMPDSDRADKARRMAQGQPCTDDCEEGCGT